MKARRKSITNRMRTITLGATCVIIIFVSASGVAGEIPPVARTFTNAGGRELKAELLGVEESRVNVRRLSDGSRYSIDLETLSATDQEFVRQWQREAAKGLPAITPGRPFDYTPLAFQPKSWENLGLEPTMVPWTGSEIVFLTLTDGFDAKLISGWVRQLDRGWRLYADLTGRSPRLFKQIGEKPVVAAVPGAGVTCGAGCGYLGATGIELALFYSHDYPRLERNPDAISHYVFYEMGRNYYTFGNRHSCFTTGFAVFMRYVCMDTLGCVDEDAKTREIIEGVEKRFATSPLGFMELFTNAGSLSEKEARIRDDAGKPVHPSDQPVTYASAMLRLRRDCGDNDWLKRFFSELAACPEVKPVSPEAALTQCWHWFLCASAAARKDLSPIFVDEWRMPLGKPTRQALGEIDWTAENLSVAKILKSIRPDWE